MTATQELAALRAEVASMREELAAVSKPKASSVAAVVQPKAAFPYVKEHKCSASPKCEFVARSTEGAAHHLTEAEASRTGDNRVAGHRIFKSGVRSFAKA